MTKERHEEAMEMGQPTTPKSEKPRAAWGSLLMQVPGNGCPTPKCIKRPGHEGVCWPT